MNEWVTWGQAKSEAAKALKATWLFIMLGVLISLGLFWVSLHISESTLSGTGPFSLEQVKSLIARNKISELLLHLSGGFLVASIAVFAYEWGAHLKKAFELSRDLNNLIRSDLIPIFDGGKLSQDLNFLIRSEMLPIVRSVGKEAIRKGCDGLSLGATDKSKCLESVRQLMISVADLSDEKLWAADQCLGFVSGLLEKVVIKNLPSFSALAHNRKGEELFEVPQSAAQITDAVLAAQMNGLENGDIYEVVSDIYSWKESGDWDSALQLSRFWSESESAVGRGVEIRRIFNVCLASDPQSKLTESQIRNILTMHLQAVTNWRGLNGGSSRYQIKVFGDAELAHFRPALRNRLRTKHGGVFRHRVSAGEELVRFSVVEPDLAKMAICRDPDVIDEDIKIFKTLWEDEQIPNLTESVIGRVVGEIQGRMP